MLCSGFVGGSQVTVGAPYRFVLFRPESLDLCCAIQQVAITIGASQALYLAFQAILSHGDEVILLEPYFDLYLGQVKMAGGVVKPVPLQVENGEFRLDVEALRRCDGESRRNVEVKSRYFTACCVEDISAVVLRRPRYEKRRGSLYHFHFHNALAQALRALRY